ncbi:25292_t:CDS:2, partial [Gigaspora rosea]
SATGTESNNERHMPYKKDKGGGGHSTSKENPSLDKLCQRMKDYTDTANHSGHPFTTYTQKTQNNQQMTTRLDYIFVDNDHIQFCQYIQTLFGTPIICLLKCLMNENIKKDIEKELQGHIIIDTWDVLKNRIQAKIRQYKPCSSPEKKVTKLYKKIAELQEVVIRYPEREELKIVIEKLQIVDTTPVNILQYAKVTYEKLYKLDRVNLDAVTEFLVIDQTVSEEQNYELVKKITAKEIEETIGSLVCNKVPGVDRLSYEFYKRMKVEIIPVLKTLFNEVLKNSKIPKSWDKSIITFIPKKAENLDELTNWRPISLTNSEFVLHHSTIDMVLDVLSVLRNQLDKEKKYWIAFIDQQKTFDRISHVYLIEILQKMKFFPIFIGLVQQLFSNQTAHIADAGLISESFKVKCGVRQGNPLSSLLFIIAFEPFLQKLARNLQGIKVEKEYFKVVTYADDLTVGIGSLEDWARFRQIVKRYKEASNSKINKTKSIIAPLTRAARKTELEESRNFKFAKENEIIPVLEYKITIQGMID